MYSSFKNVKEASLYLKNILPEDHYIAFQGVTGKSREKEFLRKKQQLILWKLRKTLKDKFYLEMVSFIAIDDTIQTPKKEMYFFFFSACCIVFNCSWQLIMFDKKQTSCVKHIHLVTDDRKAFYTVKIVCYSSSMNDGEFINYYSLGSDWKKKSFIKPAILNLTYDEIPKDYRSLLNLGPKYLRMNKRLRFVDIITSTEFCPLDLEYNRK